MLLIFKQISFYYIELTLFLPSIRLVNVFLRSIKKGKVSESIHLLKILSSILITVILNYWNHTEKYIDLIYLEII